MHERRSVASNVKARERYQANSEQKRADERQRYRRDPEANRARKRASRHPILICSFPCINMYISFLLLPGSYDDDPGSKRDAERARYEKDPETKGQNTTQTLNRSKTLKEHGTRKTLNPSGLVSVNAFMLKQESS